MLSCRMPDSSFTPAPGRPLLFFDLAEVDLLHQAHLVICPATKHPGNPVMPLGDMNAWDSRRASPWAGRTVIYDAEARLLKMTRASERQFRARLGASCK